MSSNTKDMSNKVSIAMIAGGCASLLACLIASIVSLNCLADKKMQCAQVNGFIAMTFSCLGAVLLAFLMFVSKKV